RTAVTSPAGTITYTVDAAGQLISNSTGVTYTYDPAGNLTATSAGDSFTYNSYGQTVAATAGGTSQTYGYDADGIRVTIDGATQLWDRTGLPLLLQDSAGNEFTHGPDGIHTTNTDYPLTDAIGSVRTTASSTGAVTGTAVFDPYGQGTPAGTFGFAGEQTDPTGLIHLRARQYQPGLGRFTSVDPVQPGAPGTAGWNHYTYTANNPTTWTDPTGRSTLVGEKEALRPAAYTAPTVQRTGLTLTEKILSAAVIALGFQGECTREQPGSVSGGGGGLGHLMSGACDVFAGNPAPNEPQPGSGPAPEIRERARDRGISEDELEECWANYRVDPDACRNIPEDLLPSELRSAPNGAGARFVAGSDGVVVDVLGGSPNAVVLGKYPAYVNQGAATGARTFSMSDDAWNALSPAEQWVRNQQFLDDAISRGSEIHLATDLTPSNLTGFFAREIEYLSKQGYVPNASGTQMVPGG
ncbi:MAG: hypothetical protein GY701_32255, partial [Sulfitobacter sp.]|nr:hypothetical protein [Sulfitobacter sp.]